MKIYNLINLTPHDINAVNKDRKIILTVRPSGKIARCTETVKQLGQIAVNNNPGNAIVTIPIIHKELGKVENLPESQEGVLYIVSLAVAKAAPERNDLLIPGQAVRDEQGRIIGTSALAKV